MREQQTIVEATFVDWPPNCEDCHIVTALRSVIRDSREGRQISVYQCSNCGRLAWKDDAIGISGELGGAQRR